MRPLRVRAWRRSYARSASRRLRLVVALAALAAGATLVGRSATATTGGTRALLLLGAIALGLQILWVTRAPGAAAPAVALLGVVGGVALAPGANDGLAVEVAVLFLAACELSAWAARLRSVIPETRSSVRHQLGLVAATLAGGGLVAAVVASAGRALEGPEGRSALALGVAAATIPAALLAAGRLTAGRAPARRRRLPAGGTRP
jgi:hypothetical protein